MIPIRTDMKSKRRHWDGCPGTSTWMWLKYLREGDDTRKIYNVNPYVEVYRFRDNLYGFYSDNLDGKGDVWIYLIIGPERAMLIDTSYGLGNLKALVDEITGGMEVIVVNTHDHYDHAYGNCYFPKVYCHEHLVPYLENQHAHMWDYVLDSEGKGIWVDFDGKDLPQFKPYEIVGVPDGYTWNLGQNYEIQLILTGGHSAGHGAYLDKKNRILFSGDVLCSDLCGIGDIPGTRKGPYAEEASMTFFRERLKILADREEEYDRVFPQHFINDLDKRIVTDTLAAVDRICENPGNWDFEQTVYGKDRNFRDTVYFKHIPGFSMIRYRYKGDKTPREERIYKPQVPNAITEAAWRRFREHNKTKRIYDVNPHAEVYEISGCVFGLYQPLENEGWRYLIAGRDEALLIGNPEGAESLYELCSFLTGGKKLKIAGADSGSGFWKLDEETEILRIPAETSGPEHEMYLDKRDRILFGGDNICQDRMVICGPGGGEADSRTVESCRDQLLEAKKHMDEFDYIFPEHYLGFIENHVLDDVLDTLNQILEEPEACDFREPYAEGEKASAGRMYRRVKGFGDVVYEWDSIFPKGRETETVKKHLSEK